MKPHPVGLWGIQLHTAVSQYWVWSGGLGETSFLPYLPGLRTPPLCQFLYSQKRMHCL